VWNEETCEFECSGDKERLEEHIRYLIEDQEVAPANIEVWERVDVNIDVSINIKFPNQRKRGKANGNDVKK
jgi:hypothetical protein